MVSLISLLLWDLAVFIFRYEGSYGCGWSGRLKNLCILLALGGLWRFNCIRFRSISRRLVTRLFFFIIVEGLLFRIWNCRLNCIFCHIKFIITSLLAKNNLIPFSWDMTFLIGLYSYINAQHDGRIRLCGHYGYVSFIDDVLYIP